MPKLTLISVWFVAALLLLTGCTPEAKIEASLSDGRVVFGVCDPIHVESIRVDEYSENSSETSRNLWTLSGSADWEAGEFLYLGSEPAGFTESSAYSPLEEDASEIYLVLNSPSETEGLETRVATFDPGQLVEGKWSSQDGHLRDVACG